MKHEQRTPQLLSLPKSKGVRGPQTGLVEAAVRTPKQITVMVPLARWPRRRLRRAALGPVATLLQNLPTLKIGRHPGADATDTRGMSLPRCVLAGTTYLVTRRCIGRRFLLRPDRALNELFVYCLGLAAQEHGVRLHALCVMSNHYHLVLTHVRGCSPSS